MPVYYEGTQAHTLEKIPSWQDEIAAAMGPIIKAIEQSIGHDLKITNICLDADDDNIIACAMAAKADYLVTGDSDLLVIKRYKAIRIITPRDFEALFV